MTDQQPKRKPGRPRKEPVDATRLSATDLSLLAIEAPPAGIEDIARDHAGLALKSLVAVLHGGKSEVARINAASMILDRGWGRPSVEAGGETGWLPFAPVSSRAVPVNTRVEAQRHARAAIEIMRRIAEFGKSDAARVSAARCLLDRGLGLVAAAKVPDRLDDPPALGKREAAALAAEAAAVGAYATPAAPSSPAKRLDS